MTIRSMRSVFGQLLNQVLPGRTKPKDDDIEGLFDFRDYARSGDMASDSGWDPGRSIKAL
jgi:hypothetical protein